MRFSRLLALTAAANATYSEVENRGAGPHFFAISAHLGARRHSCTPSSGTGYAAPHAAHARAVSKVNRIAPCMPMIFGGDTNSCRTKSHAPFN